MSNEIEHQESTTYFFKGGPIICLRPSWNNSFGITIKALKSLANSVPRDITSVRILTDNGIPTWLPTLPSGISCKYNEYIFVCTHSYLCHLYTISHSVHCQ